MSTLDLIATHHGLADKAVLNRIAPDYQSGWFRSLPSDSAMASMVTVELPTTPNFYLITDQAVETLQKKIASCAKRSPGASKLLRLRQRAQALDVSTSVLDGLLKKEADRLIGRALTLTQRHGSKARVRIATLSQLSNAGFIKTADLDAVKVAMMPSQMVSDLVSKVNGDENLRWKLYRSSASPELTTTHMPGKARRGVKTAVSCRKKVGMPKVQKPLTKAAFLLLKDSDGNLLPASAKKQALKHERAIKAQSRRRNFKANGGAKVGGAGESAKQNNPAYEGSC